MKSAEEIESILPGFTGTQDYYQYGRMLLTDGAKFVAESCEAYWLFDIISSLNLVRACRNEEFLTCKLRVVRLKHETKAVFTATDGGKNGREAVELYRQSIPLTDFPLDEIKLYVRDGVIFLPSEY